MNKSQIFAVAAVAASGFLGSAAQAAGAVWNVDLNPTNGFGGVTGTWAINAPGSALAAWNVFNGTTDTAPDAGSFGPAPQSVTELSGAAFLTGGGNIYSFSAPTSFEAVLTGYGSGGGTRDLVLRLETIGTAVDLSSILLNGIAPDVSQLAYSLALGGMGGDEEERLFVWNDFTDAPSYEFSFASLGSSMSLDQVALYASPAAVVPLPATIWLLGSAFASLGVWRRRFSR